MTFESVSVLGIPVAVVTGEEVLNFVRRRVTESRPAQAVTVNVEFVIRARGDPVFREVLEGADLATPESAGIRWALRRRGIKTPAGVGGSDLIWAICLQAAEEGHGVFLLGAVEGVAALAARRLVERFPDLIITGTHSGSPSIDEEDEIADLIRATQADILFVAFGAPQQDIWIARNLERTGVKFAMGVGGSFDFVAGVVRRAPRWMRERNIEWLWRLMQEPWRWRRMLALPRFAWLVLREDAIAGPKIKW